MTRLAELLGRLRSARVEFAVVGGMAAAALGASPKRAAGRPKDLESIAELEALREERGERA